MRPHFDSLALDPEALLSHDRWLRGLVARLVDADAVEDVVQETWAKALARPPAAARALRGWLATVAQNFARRSHRSDARRRQREGRAARPEQQADTAEIVQRVEAQRRVSKLVLELAEPYRTTVLLRFFEDLSTQEIADRTGVPHATVRTRLQRAVARLRSDLTTSEGQDWQQRYAALFLGLPGLGTTVASASITKTLLTGVLMMSTKLKVAAAILLAAGLSLMSWGFDPDSAAPDGTPDGVGVADLRGSEVEPRHELAGGTGEVRVVEPKTPIAKRTPLAKSDDALPTWQLRGRVTDRLGRPMKRVPIVLHSIELKDDSLPDDLEDVPQKAADVEAAAGAPGEAPVQHAAESSSASPSPPSEGRRLLGYSDEAGEFDLTAPKVDGRLLTAGEFVALRASQAQPATAAKDATSLDDRLLVVAPAVTVSGRVRDKDHRAIAGARFHLHLGQLADYPGILDTTIGVQFENGFTDGKGRFRYRRVPAIPECKLRFQKTGFDETDHRAPERATTGIDVQMARVEIHHYEVRGIVRDSDGEPVAGAKVSLGAFCATLSKADGRFELRPDAIWSKPPLIAVKHGYQLAMNTDVVKALNKNGKPQVDLELVLAGKSRSIRGTVVDHRGAPRAGLRVYVLDPTFLGGGLDTAEATAAGKSSPMFGIASRTDAKGHFRLDGLADRAYVLRVHDQMTKLTLNTKAITAGTDDLRIEIPMDAMREKVTGRVVSHSGVGIPEVHVFVGLALLSSFGTIRNAEGKKVRTDKNGYFTLPDVSRREVHLNVRGDKIVPLEHQLPETNTGTNLTIRVERRCHFKFEAGNLGDNRGISVAVLDEEQKPLTIYSFSAHGWSSTTRWNMWKKTGTQALAVSERAAWLVVYKGYGKNSEIRRQGMRLKAGVVTHLFL